MNLSFAVLCDFCLLFPFTHFIISSAFVGPHPHRHSTAVTSSRWEENAASKTEYFFAFAYLPTRHRYTRNLTWKCGVLKFFFHYVNLHFTTVLL